MFRRLAERVDVHVVYRGAPGSMRVDATLAMPNGWREVFPLQQTRRFSGTRHDELVQLDLPALERRVRAVGAETGLPSEVARVEVVPTVTVDGRTWSPALAFELTPLQLRLVDGEAALVVREGSSAPAAASRPEGLLASTRSLPGPAVAALLTLAAVLAAAVLLVRTSGTWGQGEVGRIHRRWPGLLVLVAPVPVPAGRPVVEVPAFEALARVAVRYGLLVLHWRDAGVETFVVHDEAATYRYRTSAAAPPLRRRGLRARGRHTRSGQPAASVGRPPNDLRAAALSPVGPGPTGDTTGP
ncbi:MAG: hypothetical protein M3P93_08945 [Actinomycetota bacterium]|nr:hypothetical protein [Actinomycetota bacterium]